jgi:hypothetical protein
MSVWESSTTTPINAENNTTSLKQTQTDPDDIKVADKEAEEKKRTQEQMSPGKLLSFAVTWLAWSKVLICSAPTLYRYFVSRHCLYLH